LRSGGSGRVSRGDSGGAGDDGATADAFDDHTPSFISPAVSIHAYSPPMTLFTTYEETPLGLVASGLCWDDDRR
jgi:hypothetical protein